MQKIEYTKTNGIGRIVLNNAANRNAIDLSFCKAFSEIAAEIAADDSLLLVAIQAKGDYFSVGGDLRAFLAEEEKLQEYILNCVSNIHAGLRYLSQINVPVILALEGLAAGGGFSLVCSADMVIANKSAKLVSGYTKSSLTPDMGGSYFLPRLVGWQKAFAIMALNKPIDADEAKELGLVTEVVDNDDFAEHFENTLEKLAAMPQGVLGDLKQVLRESQHNSLSQQLDAEGLHMSHRAGMPVTLETLKKFLG